MAYDLELVQKLDRLAAGFGIFAKKKMFGGVCYLINGNMAFGIHKQWLIIRSSASDADELLKSNVAKPFALTGRPMTGWVQISSDVLKSDNQLIDMLGLSMSYVKTLPKK